MECVMKGGKEDTHGEEEVEEAEEDY